jgi:hypothetical protein
MFNRVIVQEALNRSINPDGDQAQSSENHIDDESSVTSLLIHDIFGGEILKTHKKKGWHFYNRIDGERIDLTKSPTAKGQDDNHFDDLPSTPEETYKYFEKEDYSTFLMRFIRIFEESTGLDNYRPGFSA